MAEGKNEKDEQKQLVEREGEDDEQWEMHQPDPSADGAKKHTTSMKEANCDKYRITFEAHQLVTKWFSPSEAPSGMVSKGILIVPGAHASLDNISESGEWLQDETYQWMGQMRSHKKGMKVGRSLSAWRKIREESPELLKHYTVMSQPSSNMDGVLMAWSIRDDAKRHPVSLHQRDCFGAAFTTETMSMQHLAHEVPCSVMAKMTAALQLTDTDFSHQFKQLARNGVDECIRKGQQKIRKDAVGTSEIYKMSIKDIAQVLHDAMEVMVAKNEQDQWVLSGLRRNGFLALRPDENGIMKYQDGQAWCKDMPLGSTRIPKEWLLNRFTHVKDGGRTISEPIWSRMEGASELADLVEYSHHEKQKIEEADIGDLQLDEMENESWIQAGRFQLPVDLRKALAVREGSMSSTALDRRDKMREKRKARKTRMEARKQISAEEKEKIQQELQSKSRHEVMLAVEPAAKTAKPSQVKKAARKNKQKQKHQAISAAKKSKKGILKHQKRILAAKMLKDKKQHKKQDETMGALPPLPAPDVPPPISESFPEGMHRITSDQSLPALYGRQGEIIGEGEHEFTMKLEKNKRFPKEQVCKIRKDMVAKIPSGLPLWSWGQLTLSRYLKQEILQNAGTIRYDVASIPEWDAIEIVQEKIVPPGGLESQTMLFGFELLQIQMNGKGSGAYPGYRYISPVLPQAVLLQHQEGVDEDKLCKALQNEMQQGDQVYLVPIGSGQHWTLMVLDLPQKTLRYYDSINGDLHERCLASAEIFLGYLLEKQILKPGMLDDQPGLRRAHERRQPMMSNQCGHYVLAFAEMEMASKVYGPAAIEWDAPMNWHQRLSKLTQQLQSELDKVKTDLVEAESRRLHEGNKQEKERKKLNEIAEQRMQQGLELTALQKMAYEQIHEHKRTGLCL